MIGFPRRALALGLAVAGMLAPGSAGFGQAQGLVISEGADFLICRDSGGQALRLPKRPKRVIVNYSSFVGPWYACGGTAIAVPEAKDPGELPAAARGLPTTGRTTAPNVERILELQPDLVILSSSIEKQLALREVLAASGVATLALDYENYADYRDILALFSRLNGTSAGLPPGELAAEARIGKLAAKTRASKAPGFISVFASARDLLVESGQAHTAFMASYLGARNVAEAALPSAKGKDKSPLRVALSLERIHLEDPDVILVTTMGSGEEFRRRLRDELSANEAWAGLRAVREGRVFVLPNELFLYKPNERFPEAFELLASYLYPGVK
jgi:iron complex transport system substrate-binding protein